MEIIPLALFIFVVWRILRKRAETGTVGRVDATIPVSIDKCQKHIVRELKSLHLAIARQAQDGDDIYLEVLFVDVGIVIAAIEDSPVNIPVMAIGCLQLIEGLENRDNAEKESTREFLRNVSSVFAVGTSPILNQLISMRGRRLSDEEVADAARYIDSFKWDAQTKSFKRAV